MKALFTESINNWQDWGRVFQSIPAFAPLIRHILQKENLPQTEIEHLTPGTNAVFKLGDYVVKIFAPKESGIDQSLDLQTELLAIKHAHKLGVSTPKLIAEGFVCDKYRFAYMITEFVKGKSFPDAIQGMSDDEKRAMAQKLRQVTDQLNVPCKPLNDIDVIADQGRYRRWDKYPDRFKAERLTYLHSHDFGERVFVHGDLCGDNILITETGELYLIDFADAVLAPVCYEHTLVAFELFRLDPVLLSGYFGNYSVEALAELYFDGLLIHDFGGDIVEQHIGKASEFQGLEALRKRLALCFMTDSPTESFSGNLTDK